MWIDFHNGINGCYEEELVHHDAYEHVDCLYCLAKCVDRETHFVRHWSAEGFPGHTIFACKQRYTLKGQCLKQMRQMLLDRCVDNQLARKTDYIIDFFCAADNDNGLLKCLGNDKWWDT